MYADLRELSRSLIKSEDQIPPERRAWLINVANKVNSSGYDPETHPWIFICTHNSRRSHIAQVWMSLALEFYWGYWIPTYSGGTEATRVYPSVLRAMQKAGFQWDEHGQIDNPRIKLKWSKDEDEMLLFSKKYDHPQNPSKNFVAVMVCDDADANCPFIPEAVMRLSMTYKDPKWSDGSEQEQNVYYDKLLEIGREMFFFVKNLEK